MKKNSSKIMISTISIIFCANIVFAYNMPTGIPDPGFGLDEVKPARPVNWDSEVPGYYYVKDTAGCSKTAEYGYPGSPICYIPNPIPAGSYVEVHGTYNHSVGGNTMIHGVGTSAHPVWVVGESDQNRPIFTENTIIYGSYIYLEHINSKLHKNSTGFQVGRNRTGYKGDHIMVRHCLLEGDNSSLTHAITTLSYDEVGSTDYLIIVDNIIRNHGDVQSADDQDAHCITINKTTNNVWVLDNDISSCSGSGVQLGQEHPGAHETDVVGAYVAGNHIHNNRQAGVGIKGTSNVVISENDIHDQITQFNDDGTWGSPSKCVGWKGRFENIWIINNKCSNNSFGIHGGSTDTGEWDGDVYIIGNTFQNIQPNKDDWNYLNPWESAAISLVGSTVSYAINNTIHNSCAGIATPTMTRHYIIENNIIDNLSDDKYIAINIRPISTTIVRNNIIHQEGTDEHILWGGANYTVATFKSETSQCAGCVNDDPLFVNTGAQVFNLLSDSPAIDSGLSETKLSLDVYEKFKSFFGLDIRKDRSGTIRPQGSGWDMGAFEYDEGQRSNMGSGGGSGGIDGQNTLQPPVSFQLVPARQ